MFQQRNTKERGSGLTEPCAGFSAPEEKIASLAIFGNDETSRPQQNEFAGMTQEKIAEKLKNDTERFLSAGGKIQQIPAGEGVLATVFQDKN